jgi:hypothetical protein
VTGEVSHNFTESKRDGDISECDLGSGEGQVMFLTETGVFVHFFLGQEF